MIKSVQYAILYQVIRLPYLSQRPSYSSLLSFTTEPFEWHILHSPCPILDAEQNDLLRTKGNEILHGSAPTSA